MHPATESEVLSTIRANLQRAQEYLSEQRCMEGLTKARLDGLHIAKLGSPKKQEAVLHLEDPSTAGGAGAALPMPPLVYVIKHPQRHFARIHFEALGLGKRTQTFAVKIEDLRRFLFPPKRRNSKQQWERYWSMLPETEPDNEYMIVNCLYFIHYGDQGGTVQFDEEKPWTKCKDTKKDEPYQFPYRRWSTMAHCENYRAQNGPAHRSGSEPMKRLEAACAALDELHREAPRHNSPFEADAAQIHDAAAQLQRRIDGLFEKYKIHDRDYFAWFRKYETRLVNHRNQALHRQLKEQNDQYHSMQQRIHELERQLKEVSSSAAHPAAPAAAASPAPAPAPVTDDDFRRLAADHFRGAPHEEKVAVNYAQWQNRPSGLIPEALGRMLHHRQWHYTLGMAPLRRNQDVVQLYNSLPGLPDCLVRRSERSNQYVFVTKHEVDTTLNDAVRTIEQRVGMVGLSPHLSFPLKYQLGEFLTRVLALDQQGSLSSAILDYQDLRTHFLSLLGHGTDEDTLSHLLQVALHGGTYNPPNGRHSTLSSRLALGQLRGDTAIRRVRDRVRDELNSRVYRSAPGPARVLDYMYIVIDSLRRR